MTEEYLHCIASLAQRTEVLELAPAVRAAFDSEVSLTDVARRRARAPFNCSDDDTRAALDHLWIDTIAQEVRKHSAAGAQRPL